MTLLLARPSFWPEPRDPSAWQRALRRMAALSHVPDPRPCWEEHLRTILPRRSVPGLYGQKAEGALLGAGLVVSGPPGWGLAPEARPLLDADRDTFHEGLARWLVLRSPWLRLALRRLVAGRWALLPQALSHRLRVGVDLVVDEPLLDPGCEASVSPHDLSPLQSPLYLLRSLGWLDDALLPRLPADLADGLTPPTPATVLRAATAAHADPSGFVPVDHVARALWIGLNGPPAPRSLARWGDAVFGAAIEGGTLEVHDWAPGQPRHGRGLYGDRDRKRARWTVHDDFQVSQTVLRANDEDVP